MSTCDNTSAGDDVGLTDLPQHDLTRISRLAAGR
jgi:hypothetical protein